MLNGLPFVYRQFWTDFVQTGNEAYREFYDDPFVQAYVLYTFTSVFHRANPGMGGKFLAESEYRSHIVPVLKKDPHLLHTFAATSNVFAAHLRELSFRGSFHVDTSARELLSTPRAWSSLHSICAGLQMNVPYFKATLSHYLGLHYRCLEELGVTRAASKSKKVQAYEQAKKDFVTFDSNIADDVPELLRFVWRRPRASIRETTYANLDEVGDFTALPDLARSAHFGSFGSQKMDFPREVRNYDIYLGDILIQAYEQIESLREWTGLPFDSKTFGVLQGAMKLSLPDIHHPKL